MDAAARLRLEPCPVPGSPDVSKSVLRAAPGRGPRLGNILVMDDNLMVRETMRRQLLVLGYEVAVVAKGREAVAAYEQARRDGKPFGAVVLGVRTDGGCGREQVLAELRNLDPGVKAMIWSDWLDPGLRADVQRGNCCVLGKPHALDELRLKLAELLLR